MFSRLFKPYKEVAKEKILKEFEARSKAQKELEEFVLKIKSIPDFPGEEAIKKIKTLVKQGADLNMCMAVPRTLKDSERNLKDIASFEQQATESVIIEQKTITCILLTLFKGFSFANQIFALGGDPTIKNSDGSTVNVDSWGNCAWNMRGIKVKIHKTDDTLLIDQKPLGLFKLLSKPSVFNIESPQARHSIRKPKHIAKNIEELNQILNDDKCVRVSLNINKVKKNVKAVRFLLTADNRLVFGPEGRPDPGNDIPAHAHLAELKNIKKCSCITAGDAYFSEDNHLIAINHQSGDFRPSFDSLQFVLPQLRSFSIPMANSIIIYELGDSGGSLAEYNISGALLTSSDGEKEIETRALRPS